MKIEGYEASLTRRRYGNITYTWIHFLINKKWQESGDPLPKIMPSRKDYAAALERAIRYRNLSVITQTNGIRPRSDATAIIALPR